MINPLIRGGDVYCPFCGDQTPGYDFTFTDSFWTCDRCRKQWKWDHNGIDWVWPEDRDPTTPGCPKCGTHNIQAHAILNDDRFCNWTCLRELCGINWRGRYEALQSIETGRWRVSRWLIRIPARDVPFRRTLDNPTTYPHQETS